MGRWVREFPSPLCLLRESFVLVLYWLQLICLLHPLTANLPAQCTAIRGLGSQSVPTACRSPVDVLTYVPGIPYGKWQQKMVKRLLAEPDEKTGDTNNKKGHILHLKNQHSKCSCQLKKKHSQGASFHGRKGMSQMRCHYTHFTEAVQLPELSGSLRLYAKMHRQQLLSSFPWLEMQIQWM